MKLGKLSFLRSFRSRLTLAVVFAMLFMGAVNNFAIYRYALETQFEGLRSRLKTVAQTAALMIDASALREIPLNRSGMDTAQYKMVASRLVEVKKANPSVESIYTMVMAGRNGILWFVVDPSRPSAEDIKKGRTTYPGDKYNATSIPAMLQAFSGPTADDKLEVDEWGATLSGYAPIRDRNGKAVAILGVDMKAQDVYAAQREVNRRALYLLALSLLISILLSSLIARRVSEPIRKLVDGTRHISGGDLQYKVKVDGTNEIEELGAGFNQMAMSLYESRKKLINYFYGVIQSLVRILEARDPYTKGHSDRVARYAEQISAKMGIDPEKRKLLGEAALLHDIGKLGVKEVILNKQVDLTESEWEAVRKHPAIGEEILKPVSVDDEILEVIREHHEQYDGKGYPDHIGGESINILAAIISVADAYDAMTTERTYSKAISKEEAIGQLEKKSGVKFNPRVVEAFINILKEE